MRLLLDTSTLIWLANEPERLSASARDAVSDPANVLLLSSVSVYELAQKVSLAKLEFAKGLSDFLQESRDEFGIVELPLTVRHALRAQEMHWHHRDPFDRLLIAQALAEDVAIVTSDRLFAAYGVRVLS